MIIKEKTRRNITDELRVNQVVWNGRLDQIAFLKRIFNIEELPSSDHRYKTMEQDIIQHTQNNNDWNDDWIYDDSRLNLLHCSDEIFLNFLCEMIHPIVRIDVDEIQMMVDIFNDYLKEDGFKLLVKDSTSSRRIFIPSKLDNDIVVDLENKDKISKTFIIEQLKKSDDKIKSEDYDGAITNAKSMLESSIKDIYNQITGLTFEPTSTLPQQYNELKSKLNLSIHKDSDEEFKKMSGNLTALVLSISSIRNKMSDSHEPETKALRHHAKMVVGCSKIAIDFLYDVFYYQKSRIELFRDWLINKSPYMRYGDGVCHYGECHNIKNREDFFIKNPKYKNFNDRCDYFTKRILIDDLINNYEINSFDNSDKFFISMIIFFDLLTMDDVVKIFNKTKDNNQANFKLHAFLKDMLVIKKDYINQDMNDFINKMDSI